MGLSHLKTAVISPCWCLGPQTRKVAKSGSQTLLCRWPTVGDNLDSNRYSWDLLVEITYQSESYISPSPKPTSSESSKMAAFNGASGGSGGWPDLAAIGRVKIYGCSYRRDTKKKGFYYYFLLGISRHIKGDTCGFTWFSSLGAFYINLQSST